MGHLQEADQLLTWSPCPPLPCSIEERENGWIMLRMGLKLGGDPAMFRDNNVVLLSLSSEAAARCCTCDLQPCLRHIAVGPIWKQHLAAQSIARGTKPSVRSSLLDHLCQGNTAVAALALASQS